MLFAGISQRIRHRLGTLRFRLLLWNSLVLILASAVLLLGVRASLRYLLLAEVDELLREDAEQVRLTIQAMGHDLPALRAETDRQAESHRQRGLFISIWNQDGVRLWKSGEPPPAIDAKPLFGRWAVPFTAGEHRVREDRLASPVGGIANVRVGTSAKYVYDDIARLTQTMFFAIAIMVVVAPLGGYWLAWRATRPLADIIATARRLRPSQLDERLRVIGNNDELDLLAETINSMLDRIADYIARHRAFVADAAHELRSPLAALRSTAEVTLASERDSAEYKEVLGEIIDRIDDLTYLANQLLLLAETEKKTEREAELVRLDTRVERSIAMFTAAAEVQGIDLCCAGLAPATIRGIPYHLDQLINNLVDNALKFTPSGGRVTIRLKSDLPFPNLPPDGFMFADHSVLVHGRDLRWTCLQIEDTGHGIAPCDLPRIFDRFYRVDKSRVRDERRGSTGLGLSICRAIVTAHQGLVIVESRLGNGSRFSIYFPLAEEAAPHYQSAPMFA